MAFTVRKLSERAEIGIKTIFESNQNIKTKTKAVEIALEERPHILDDLKNLNSYIKKLEDENENLKFELSEIKKALNILNNFR